MCRQEMAHRSFARPNQEPLLIGYFCQNPMCMRLGALCAVWLTAEGFDEAAMQTSGTTKEVVQ